MIAFVVKSLTESGVKFIFGSEISSIVAAGESKKVYFQHLDGSEEFSDEFDTVLFAAGRKAATQGLNLESIGVTLINDKLKVDEYLKTNVSNIYAVGDVASGLPNFTPTAAESGRTVARNLFSRNVKPLSVSSMASTVYTPQEYSHVGLSEEKALETFGNVKIVVYRSSFITNDFYEQSRICYVKMITTVDETVVGLHYFGPAAGEVIQGFAVAFQKGLTLKDLQQSMPVHPTFAQEIVKLSTSKQRTFFPKSSAC